MKIKRKFCRVPKVLNISEKSRHSEKDVSVIENDEPKFDEYFRINHNLAPPYNILMDTNFILHSVRKRMDIETELMRVLFSNVKICVPECVFAEIEKMGLKYRVALMAARKLKHQVLICDHKGTYADDCIIDRITPNRCYIVATCDADLKRRIRRIPGVPILYINARKYAVESLPNV